MSIDSVQNMYDHHIMAGAVFSYVRSNPESYAFRRCCLPKLRIVNSDRLHIFKKVLKFVFFYVLGGARA